MLDYDSIAAICKAAEEKQIPISALVLSDQAEQMEIPKEDLYDRMKESLHVMQEAVKEGKNPKLRSTSGLTGGDAAKMEAYAAGGGITGSFLNHAMARAIAVSEYNAAMGKIVASPTAGSCGILPGTVISMLEEGRCDEHAAVMALFTAGAVGMVIARNASIAGAQGGCQAECGSASAMAAAALVELFGGTPGQAGRLLYSRRSSGFAAPLWEAEHVPMPIPLRGSRRKGSPVWAALGRPESCEGGRAFFSRVAQRDTRAFWGNGAYV